MTTVLSPGTPSVPFLPGQAASGFSVAEPVRCLGKPDNFTRSQRPTLLFSGTAPSIDGYPGKDLQFIGDLLQRCEYRKPLEQFLPDDSSFQVSIQDGEVIVDGDAFHPPREDGRILGDCRDLTYFVMQKLERRMGRRYEFACVVGQSEKYFTGKGTHLYLIGRKKRSKWFFPSLNQEIQKIIASGSQKLPPDCLLIDPSFSVLKSTNHPTDYRLTKLSSDSLLNEDWTPHNKFRVGTFEGRDKTLCWPLGYLAELSDRSRLKLNKEGPAPPRSTMLYWQIIQTEDPPQYDIGFSLQAGPGNDTIYCANMLRLLKEEAPDNVLRQFANKVRKQLGHQDMI